MSKYTTQVRFICETLAGYDVSQGYGNVQEIINQTWDKVFDFDFPIFDEEYRSVLCKKILKHYYTREIGMETVGLWKLRLDTKMNEIMPYFNQLYESAKLEWNPLNDADYTKTHEGEDAGESASDGTHTGTVGDVSHDETDGTVWNVFSDTPQGALTNVQNETYLTDARKITEDRESDGRNTRTYNEANGVDSSFSNTNEYIEHVVGKMPGKSYSKMIMEFRNTFLNIDVDVIDALSDLFMKLW